MNINEKAFLEGFEEILKKSASTASVLAPFAWLGGKLLGAGGTILGGAWDVVKGAPHLAGALGLGGGGLIALLALQAQAADEKREKQRKNIQLLKSLMQER